MASPAPALRKWGCWSAIGANVAPLSEESLRQQARKVADLYGWGLRYHAYRSDRSDPGWPDECWINERDRRILIVEFKSTKGRLTGMQVRWIAALRSCGIRAEVWRPCDLTDGTIAGTLGPRRLGWPDAEAPDRRH